MCVKVLVKADGKQGDFNGGLLYQFRGGRSVGKWIIGMQTVGWMLLTIPYYGSQNGLDSLTTGLLEPSIALINSGGIAFKWTMYEFMVFFSSWRCHVMCKCQLPSWFFAFDNRK